MKDKIFLYDTTLRDGAQTSTINFTVKDKIEISLMLDKIGVDYIEGGWPGSNIIDNEFFQKLPKLQSARFSAFGMTRRARNSAEADVALNSVIEADIEAVCIVGKSWDFHLKHALNISSLENIAMIQSSIQQIVKKGKEAIFDAEHFFDGFKADPDFAINVAKAAYEAGSRWVVLCDTNGGTLPNEIYDIVTQVVKHIPKENIGIHCHNDTGNAVANSLVAVQAGVRQVQGTINGVGERCGNANLISIIPTLVLKMGFKTNISADSLKNLCLVSNFLNNVLEKDKDKFAPYVGEFAFAHKGGLHVSAVTKNPKSYEHIEPDLVGNKRKILISNQSGKSNILSKLKEINFDIDSLSEVEISNLVDKVKEKESQGYAYYNADASFTILVKKTLNLIDDFFKIEKYSVSHDFSFIDGIKKTFSVAKLRIDIDGKKIISESEGNGPVNAFNLALKKGLALKFPQLEQINLKDYRVKILNPSIGTKATTRVSIVTSDINGNLLTTIGVSKNILEASSEALCDAIMYIFGKI
ncbi:citramalate synthase [Flavobacteriaceae bacterium]|nr:citramalate synthase [Flavobacteriaceae bacterium]